MSVADPKGLRVADVSDGMDMAGLPGIGLVDPAIHADWVDEKDLTHQFWGFAVTARYVPTQRPDRPKPVEKFQEWEGNFCNAYSHEVFAKLIGPGSVVVIDDVEEKDIVKQHESFITNHDFGKPVCAPTSVQVGNSCLLSRFWAFSSSV